MQKLMDYQKLKVRLFGIENIYKQNGGSIAYINFYTAGLCQFRLTVCNFISQSDKRRMGCHLPKYLFMSDIFVFIFNILLKVNDFVYRNA